MLSFPLFLLQAQDSVVTNGVVPGVVHTKHVKAGPLVVDVLEIDLTNPQYRLESYRPSGLVKTSRQAIENTSRGHTVIVAVNADFFSFKTLRPLSNQVVNGKFVLGTKSPRSHVAIDEQNKVYFEQLSFKGFSLHRGHRWEIDGVNRNRLSNETVFFNSFWGPTTDSDTLGVKLVVRLAGTRWAAHDTMIFVVVSRSAEGTVSIPDDGGVLATSMDFAGVGVNDTLRMFLGFSAFGRSISQVLGGAGRILESGKDVTEANVEQEGLARKFLTDKHPRTFVGSNRDITRVFLCTVDGRQAASVGMQFNEMAKFLVSLGAWNAINLDGGGSTTMVVQGRIANSPSDRTGERPVANSLQVISRNWSE